MGFWGRESKGSQPSDYAWAHDGALAGSVDEEGLSGMVLLARWRPSPALDAGWHGAEPEGRWTGATAIFPVRAEPDWTQLRITCINHHPAAQTVDFALGSENHREVIGPREERAVIVTRTAIGDRLSITCTPIRPSSYGADDERDLGIFVKSVEFVQS